MARCHEFAVAAEEGTIVDCECHRHCRLVDCNARQRFGVLRQCYRVADFEAFETYDCADVAVAYTFHLLAAHALECMKFFYALARYSTVFAAEAYFLTLAKFTAVHTPYGYTPHVLREVE